MSCCFVFLRFININSSEAFNKSTDNTVVLHLHIQKIWFFTDGRTQVKTVMPRHVFE